MLFPLRIRSWLERFIVKTVVRDMAVNGEIRSAIETYALPESQGHGFGSERSSLFSEGQGVKRDDWIDWEFYQSPRD